MLGEEVLLSQPVVVGGILVVGLVSNHLHHLVPPQIVLVREEVAFRLVAVEEILVVELVSSHLHQTLQGTAPQGRQTVVL